MGADALYLEITVPILVNPGESERGALPYRGSTPYKEKFPTALNPVVSSRKKKTVWLNWKAGRLIFPVLAELLTETLRERDLMAVTTILFSKLEIL